MRRLVALGLVLGVLTGCSGLPESGDKGYTSGEGIVTQVAVDERADPVDLVAEDLEGNEVDLADYRGQPLVIVVWWSGCVECRVEQPEVNRAVEELEGTAKVIGLDIREPSVANARAFEREADIPYPSIDGNDGRALTAFHGKLNPYTVPSFLVLDSDGRVAASIIGSLPSRLTMVELTEEVAAESAGAARG
ncbi:MAG: TlpA family protein disulfide reductase [Actinomycetota bacterium]|nr:TlpA family protein disulfide reductase [Actinomycetota bacterium]